MKYWKTIRQVLLEQFFPTTCPYCERVTSFREPVCARCRKKLVRLTDVCPRCSKKVCTCKELHAVERIYALYPYDETVRDSLIRFKFQGHPDYAEAYAGELYEAFSGILTAERFDALVGIPMSRRAEKEREYNQTFELAGFLSEKSGIPFLKDALVKIRETDPQHLLSLKERKQNLIGAFQMNADVAGKRILLCDDIMTSGTTLDTCAALLLQSGAKSVSGIVIASVQETIEMA